VSRDPRVDSYIARQADFARPILEYLREALHSACPGAEEAIKWGMPTFLYRRKNLAMMAGFKAHATFGFWRGRDAIGETGAERDAMGQFGRLTSRADLPAPARLDEMIRQAMAVIDSGPAPRRPPRAPRAELPVPAELAAALAGNPRAAEVFAGFAPSCRREYVEWIGEAKRPETRARRVAQAVEWMSEGKRRNWKYENC
jgi:uncharacterized protein YdeI (YjbR/CyaY-like superfamily)